MRLTKAEVLAIEEQGACAEVLARPTREYTRALLAAVPWLQAA